MAARIIEMSRFRLRRSAERGFASWRERFKDPLDERTRLPDLSDKTLGSLLRTGKETQNRLYDLILGVLGLGSRTRFYYLDSDSKMRVLDASLFLTDQVRFEAMRRLGWVRHTAGEHYPIVELVLHWREIKDSFLPPFPDITPENPAYHDYLRTHPIDRETFLRRQIPRALDAFLKRIPSSSNENL